MQKWTYDREFGHVLNVDESGDAFILVYKSVADYVVTAMREGDSSGGEIEYRDTLAQAKKFGESLLINDLWKEYTL